MPPAQAQLALMEVQWPEGLYDESSTHKQQQQQDKALALRSKSSKGRTKGVQLECVQLEFVQLKFVQLGCVRPCVLD
jgi:hypothetical protein